MFNSEKFIQDSVLGALNLANSQNESKKLSAEILVAMAMEYAKKTIGGLYPAIGTKDIKDLKDEFLASSQMELLILDSKGLQTENSTAFLKVHTTGTIEIRDNKGNIIVAKMEPSVHSSKNEGAYSANAEVTTLIRDDKEDDKDKGITISDDVVPFIIEDGKAAIVGSGRETRCYFNADSLRFAQMDVMRINSTSFYDEINLHMHERSIEYDDHHAEGHFSSDNTRVIDRTNKSVLIDYVNNNTESLKSFVDKNNVPRYGNTI